MIGLRKEWGQLVDSRIDLCRLKNLNDKFITVTTTISSLNMELQRIIIDSSDPTPIQTELILAREQLLHLVTTIFTITDKLVRRAKDDASTSIPNSDMPSSNDENFNDRSSGFNPVNSNYLPSFSRSSGQSGRRQSISKEKGISERIMNEESNNWEQNAPRISESDSEHVKYGRGFGSQQENDPDSIGEIGNRSNDAGCLSLKNCAAVLLSRSPNIPPRHGSSKTEHASCAIQEKYCKSQDIISPPVSCKSKSDQVSASKRVSENPFIHSDGRTETSASGSSHRKPRSRLSQGPEASTSGSAEVTRKSHRIPSLSEQNSSLKPPAISNDVAPRPAHPLIRVSPPGPAAADKYLATSSLRTFDDIQKWIETSEPEPEISDRDIFSEEDHETAPAEDVPLPDLVIPDHSVTVPERSKSPTVTSRSPVDEMSESEHEDDAVARSISPEIPDLANDCEIQDESKEDYKIFQYPKQKEMFKADRELKSEMVKIVSPLEFAVTPFPMVSRYHEIQTRIDALRKQNRLLRERDPVVGQAVVAMERLPDGERGELSRGIILETGTEDVMVRFVDSSKQSICYKKYLWKLPTDPLIRIQPLAYDCCLTRVDSRELERVFVELFKETFAEGDNVLIRSCGAPRSEGHCNALKVEILDAENFRNIGSRFYNKGRKK